MGQDETELGQPELEQWAVSETEPRLLHGRNIPGIVCHSFQLAFYRQGS